MFQMEGVYLVKLCLMLEKKLRNGDKCMIPMLKIALVNGGCKINPFITLAFQDFAEDRDHLMKQIFPQLDDRCKDGGSHFTPVDLRWGITDQAASEKQAVRLCLDFAVACKPFFIGLIGERCLLSTA